MGPLLDLLFQLGDNLVVPACSTCVGVIATILLKLFLQLESTLPSHFVPSSIDLLLTFFFLFLLFCFLDKLVEIFLFFLVFFLHLLELLFTELLLNLIPEAPFEVVAHHVLAFLFNLVFDELLQFVQLVQRVR